MVGTDLSLLLLGKKERMVTYYRPTGLDEGYTVLLKH